MWRGREQRGKAREEQGAEGRITEWLEEKESLIGTNITSSFQEEIMLIQQQANLNNSICNQPLLFLLVIDVSSGVPPSQASRSSTVIPVGPISESFFLELFNGESELPAYDDPFRSSFGVLVDDSLNGTLYAEQTSDIPYESMYSPLPLLLQT